MKKITLLFAFLITSIGFSQEVKQDFEAEGALGGAFGNITSTNIIADPATGGTNGQVLELVSNPNGEVWQGININLTKNVELTTTKTMTIDVWSATAATILVKVNGGVNGAPEAAAELTHNGNSQWQTLSYTFNSVKDGKAAEANGVYSAFVIHVNWAPGVAAFGDVTKSDRTIYVDNISGPEVTTSTEVAAPTDAPTAPPSFAASNVISLYSEAFTPAGSISNVSWDDSEFEEITVANNKILKVTGSNFIGMDIDTYLDASAMTHLHMDYWIAIDHEAGQVLNPKLSNHANQSGETSAIDISNPINSQAEVKNWQSKDFALTGDRGAIKQFLITQAGKAGVFYVDNIYLYIEGTASVNDEILESVSLFPNPAKNTLRITSQNPIQSATIYNVIGKEVKTVSRGFDNINVSDLKAGVYIVKYTIDNAVGTSKFIKK